MRFAALIAAAATLSAPATTRAVEAVSQNDSTIGGVPSTVANVFLAGESTAAWLTAACTGDLVAMQVYWASQFGGTPTQLEQSLTLFAGGTFPTPGATLAQIPGPMLVDGVVNEYRFLDPPTNSMPLQVPVAAGQTVVVSLQFLNQSSGNPFAPSVTYDQDGCQASSNAVDVLPGGWSDACPLGITGDFVIRAVVDCAPPVPALDPRGAAALVFVMAACGAIGIASIGLRERIR